MNPPERLNGSPIALFLRSPLTKIRANERADRDDAEMFGVRALQREFHQRIAEVLAAEFLGYFRMDQLERLGRPLVDEKRRMALFRQFETARSDVIH